VRQVLARKIDVRLAEPRVPMAAENRQHRPGHWRRQAVMQNQAEQIIQIMRAQKVAIELARLQLAVRQQHVARDHVSRLERAAGGGARLPDIARLKIPREFIEWLAPETMRHPQPAGFGRGLEGAQRGCLSP
jgi:hypothetical protein